MVDNRKVKKEHTSVDALCQEWAKEAYGFNLGVGKLDMWRGERGSGAEGVICDEVMVLDKVLAKSDRYYLEFLVIWYVQDTPVKVKAQKVGMDPRRIYEEWHRVLAYLCGRLHGEGLNI